ncbi:hypothetical protein I7X12_09590 [Halosimplex litoreum]|uniref:Uncharacterized protein n=1 Tax=Halosimplex litoreum TaxID=1198301 RepID=A0A7U3WB34_9EURY|nr:hypothetical protein [Halosimplex litoreum]QPV64829.1 hypothetical protein I7X12_09590 [Halosimplex litoreum]
MVGSSDPSGGTGAPDGIWDRGSGRIPVGRLLLALAVLLLVSSGATTAVAAECHGTAATASDSRSDDDGLSYPPPDLETVVTLFPTAGRVELHVQYPARSAAEADRYEDGTVDLEWVGADDRLRTAFAGRPGSLSRRCDTVTGVTDPVASESEYGDAGATMSYRWAGVFDGNRSELVVGPTLNAHLANGTVVEVRVPAAEWTAERSTVDS